MTPWEEENMRLLGKMKETAARKILEYHGVEKAEGYACNAVLVILAIGAAAASVPVILWWLLG
jgi:hypothetical protein